MSKEIRFRSRATDQCDRQKQTMVEQLDQNIF